MRRTLALVTLLLVSVPVFGADAYFVRFVAQGRRSAIGAFVLWMDDIYFYNTNSAPAVVRLVGVSNGQSDPTPLSLTLPSHRATRLNASLDVARSWTPDRTVPMWVVHLDIPPGVVAESRDLFHVVAGSGPDFPGYTPGGKVSLPIFRGLVSAGEPQVVMGTDLGRSDSRVNVVVYNGGTESAVATIEIRRVCDDAVVDTRVATLPPNTVAQISGLNTMATEYCPTVPAVEPWTRYVVVTSTQPSFSFVTNVNESFQPTAVENGLLPIVGLGVTRSERF